MQGARWSIAGMALAALPAQALEPTAVFDKVSPSVWVVHSYEGKDRSSSLGSAVVIDVGRLVTNCHVIAKAKVVLVRRDNVMYEAQLEHADPAHDLCLLKVAHFTAPAVVQRPVKELKVGERVYAIGNPQGLEVTLSEGLISGLRSRNGEKDGDTLVQTSAPISPGSSGGGLFDTEGRLVGITTFGFRDAQNLNVALPTDWIAMVSERAQAAQARRNAKAAGTAAGGRAVPAGYPAPGSVWTYGLKDLVFGGRPTDVTIRVLRIDDSLVEEFVASSVAGGKEVRRIVDAREGRIFEYPIAGERTLLELSPYLLAANGGNTPADTVKAEGYPIGSQGLSAWVTTTAVQDWEEVSVPAGTFRALRVEVSGRRAIPAFTQYGHTGKFKIIAWYSPDVERLVKLEHWGWQGGIAGAGRLGNHDLLELQKFTLPN